MKSISKLIKDLKDASDKYYAGDEPTMSDNEYDTKEAYLKELIEKGELELTDEIIELLYSTVASGFSPKGTSVEHDYPMLSLNKANTSEDLETYYNRLIEAGAEGFVLQMKLDGLAMSAKYEDGKLIQLATRGDGVKGELLNHLIVNDNVAIKGLPKFSEGTFELRGELYINEEQFRSVNKERERVEMNLFSNPRNAATGIVKAAEKGIDYKAELTFTAYSIYRKGKQIEFEEGKFEDADKATLDEITRLGGDKSAINIGVDNLEELIKSVEEFGTFREMFQIPTDGVVIKPSNEVKMMNKLGFTSKHPIANIAYKYPGVKETTVVKDIIVTVGRTGRLTPQAIVDPVEVDGVTISNVTCHNYSWLNQMDVRIGSTVAVTRANDVIPAIDTVIDKGPNEAIETPKNCPNCNSVLHGDGSEFPKTLLCTNLECPSRFLFSMKTIVGRDYLYLEGLGDVALEALIDEGYINNMTDLFEIDEETLSKVPTGITSTGNIRLLGAGNAKNIMKSIESAKKNTDSNKLLASLNIEGMGPNTAKRLISHFGGIREVLEVNPEELSKVNQVGQTLVDSFKEHGKRALLQFNKLIELGFVINNPVVKENVDKVGTFSVSGSVEGFANRSEFVKYMENIGWEFHKSPKKSTNILFADPNGTSSKIKKARGNGTRIIDNVSDI